MTEQFLNIAPGLKLPAAEFVESKSAILGASGGGKSGALKVIEEELVKCRLPFIVFDPAGIAWGLRSSIDGKGPGLQILVVGGEHADVKLNASTGADWAREVVAANCQVIFDLSDESMGKSRQFIGDFCDEFYRAQGKSRTPRLLIIDEAHEILPQDVSKADAPSFGSVKRIVTRGRNRGIGVCLVSQRPAGIAKSVLTQCGSLMIFGVLGTPDRLAIQAWVSAWGAQDKLSEFEQGIASLRQQECWFWSPREFREFKKVRIRDFRTFHPDFTHLRKTGLLEVQPVTANVGELVERLSKQMEQVKAEKVEAAEVPKLRRRIKELETKVTQAAMLAGMAMGPPRVIEKPVVDQRAIQKAVDAAVAPWHRYRKGVEAAAAKMTEAASATYGFTWKPPPEAPTIPVTTARVAIQLDRAFRQPPPETHAPMPAKITHRGVRYVNEEIVNDGAEARLLAGERRMLTEIVRATLVGKRLTRPQVGTLAGMSYTSGSFSNYIGHIKALGLVAEDSFGFVATPAGQEANGPVDPEPTSPKELAEMWKRKLLAGERRMLDALIEAGETGLSRMELAERSGMTGSSGSFSNYVGTIKRNALATDDGQVLRAAEELRT